MESSPQAVGGWGLLLLLGLSGCGSPPPDQAASGHVTGSAAISAGAATTQAEGPVSTQTSPLERTTPQASQSEASIVTDPRAATTVPEAAAGTGSASRRGTVPVSAAELQAQREARERWYAEARESPEITVRLQALEQWAQQPGDQLDPVTYALVDEDDSVRARAQALYEQQLMREAAGVP